MKQTKLTLSILFLSVFLSSIAHARSFEGNFARYPQPQMVIRFLDQIFLSKELNPGANYSSIGAGNDLQDKCLLINMYGTATHLGINDANVGKPANALPTQSFTKWAVECISLYVEKFALSIEYTIANELAKTNTNRTEGWKNKPQAEKEIIIDFLMNVVFPEGNDLAEELKRTSLLAADSLAKANANASEKEIYKTIFVQLIMTDEFWMY